jgi:hypothetical protein
MDVDENDPPVGTGVEVVPTLLLALPSVEDPTKLRFERMTDKKTKDFMMTFLSTHGRSVRLIEAHDYMLNFASIHPFTHSFLHIHTLQHWHCLTFFFCV